MYEITGLMTDVTEGHERLSMHGVRMGLLEWQAEAMGMSVGICRIIERKL
jgi:diphthamide synthase (EF-2-diphthine--ammonia ligase)